MGAGNGGSLGEEVEPGRFEGNHIPAAEDADEAYDSRHFPRSTFECWPAGTPMFKGPKGVVTRFKPDFRTANTREEHGDVTVQSDGTTTCIIIPRWQVTTTSGVREYFQWFDICCLLDCGTYLEFLKEEHETQEDRTIMDPLIHCVTDWPKWILDKLVDLLESGVSFDKAKLLLGLARAESEKAAGEMAHALVAHAHDKPATGGPREGQLLVRKPHSK